jgi:hypothetical protein
MILQLLVCESKNVVVTRVHFKQYKHHTHFSARFLQVGAVWPKFAKRIGSQKFHYGRTWWQRYILSSFCGRSGEMKSSTLLLPNSFILERFWFVSTLLLAWSICFTTIPLSIRFSHSNRPKGSTPRGWRQWPMPFASWWARERNMRSLSVGDRSCTLRQQAQPTLSRLAYTIICSLMPNYIEFPEQTLRPSVMMYVSSKLLFAQRLHNTASPNKSWWWQQQYPQQQRDLS